MLFLELIKWSPLRLGDSSMGYHCFSRMRLRCRQPHRKMGGRLETRFQGRCGRTPRVLRGLLQVTRPAVVIRHLGWPHANQNRPLPGHKVTFFDRRGITKKNPASEATRAGLSPVIRDPYASRYRPPAEQIGRSPRRLSRGETRGRPVSVKADPITRPRLYKIAHTARFLQNGPQPFSAAPCRARGAGRTG